MKTCNKCGKIKPLTEFYKHKYYKDGLRPACKDCYYHKNSMQLQNCQRKRRYGINNLEYENKLKLQNNKCAICRKEEKLQIDHNHTTGKVRELLCRFCNTILHYFENEVKKNMFLKYLEKHK